MILSEYEAKRLELEKQLEALGDQEAEHKMELSVRYQTECKKIATQIGNLKRQRTDALKKYQTDKSYLHRKCRTEKQTLINKIHMLKMEYLTANNVTEKGEE